jgi:hypothetical protein
MTYSSRVRTLAAFLAAALVACATPIKAGQDIEFSTIDRGQYSGVMHADCLVVDSATELAELWHQIHLVRSVEPPVPDVDFTYEIVLAVFQGEQPSGGHTIAIDRITERVSGTIVDVSLSTPRPDAMVTMALTSPYHLVRLSRPRPPIEFTGCR